MACNNKTITIYQGFGTKWNNEDLLTVTFDTEISLDGFGAEFSIGNITKTYNNIENGFVINLEAQETSTLPLGAITGTLVIIDTENNKRPFSTELPFLVKDWAEGDIKLDGFDVSINAKIQENKLTINIQSASPDAATEEVIRRYISEHNLSEEAHPYIQGLIESEEQARESADNILQGNIDSEELRAKGVEETLNSKIISETERATGVENSLQTSISSEVTRAEAAESALNNKIEAETTRATGKESDLESAIQTEVSRATAEENKKVDKVATANRVYGTDGNGNQTTYPVDGFGKVDDVQVGGVSVVQNKIAILGTMAGETASDYRKASAQDTIDSGLDDRIDVLESYTPSNASSSNKFAVESEITNLQNTKQNNITDLSTIRSNAQAGKSASETIATYGNIVTHNISEFATAEQGAKADTAVQNSLKIITLGD